MVMVCFWKGNFVYIKEEILVMIDDILMYKKIVVDGVVFGCIMDFGLLDKLVIIELLKVIVGLEVIFYMVFDELVDLEKLLVIDWLVE